MLKIKLNIELINFCKYSKFMNSIKNTNKITENTERNIQFKGSGIYVKEDDQDWGSSGMNDIKNSE